MRNTATAAMIGIVRAGRTEIPARIRRTIRSAVYAPSRRSLENASGRDSPTIAKRWRRRIEVNVMFNAMDFRLLGLVVTLVVIGVAELGYQIAKRSPASDAGSAG